LTRAQDLPLRVDADVGHGRKAAQKAERMKDCSVNAHSNGGITILYALKGGPSRKCTICHYSHRQLASAARIVNVGTELSKRAAHSGRSGMRSRHKYASCDLKGT